MTFLNLNILVEMCHLLFLSMCLPTPNRHAWMALPPSEMLYLYNLGMFLQLSLQIFSIWSVYILFTNLKYFNCKLFSINAFKSNSTHLSFFFLNVRNNYKMSLTIFLLRCACLKIYKVLKCPVETALLALKISFSLGGQRIGVAKNFFVCFVYATKFC